MSNRVTMYQIREKNKKYHTLIYVQKKTLKYMVHLAPPIITCINMSSRGVIMSWSMNTKVTINGNLPMFMTVATQQGMNMRPTKGCLHNCIFGYISSAWLQCFLYVHLYIYFILNFIIQTNMLYLMNIQSNIYCQLNMC